MSDKKPVSRMSAPNKATAKATSHLELGDAELERVAGGGTGAVPAKTPTPTLKAMDIFIKTA